MGHSRRVPPGFQEHLVGKQQRYRQPASLAHWGWKKVMFEAADPEVFAWYIKNHRPEVNLFVDHSQTVHLETLHSGIWGTKSLWGC